MQEDLTCEKAGSSWEWWKKVAILVNIHSKAKLNLKTFPELKLIQCSFGYALILEWIHLYIIFLIWPLSVLKRKPVEYCLKSSFHSIVKS